MEDGLEADKPFRNYYKSKWKIISDWTKASVV